MESTHRIAPDTSSEGALDGPLLDLDGRPAAFAPRIAAETAARRRGSSFQMLVAAMTLCLGALFLSGRQLLGLAGMVEAAAPAVPAVPAEPGEPAPALPVAEPEPEEAQPDVAPEAAPPPWADARLAHWTVFGSDALCIAGGARVGTTAKSTSTESPGAVPGARAGSNGAILLLGDSFVHGDARPGLGASVDRRGSAQVTGRTDALNARLELAPIHVPDVRTGDPLALEADAELALGAADHGFASIAIGAGATLRVRGPARIVTDSFSMAAGSILEVDAAKGPVELYVRGDFLLESETSLGSIQGNARDLAILLAADNLHDAGPKLDFSHGFGARGASLRAFVYAPRSCLTLDGGTDLHGWLLARIVRLDGEASVTR